MREGGGRNGGILRYITQTLKLVINFNFTLGYHHTVSIIII